MSVICGIYGFEFTKPFCVLGMKFTPLHTSLREAQAAARDLNQYNLTGTLEADELSAELRFHLEAVLSFIEHLDVILTEPQPFSSLHEQDQFPKVLFTSKRHNGGGAFIGNDTFFEESRVKFIEQAVKRLNDQDFCDATGYKILFFKTVETFRQKQPFIEVSYFLLFSGLETYVRKTLNDFDSKDVSQLLNRKLGSFGFKVFCYSQTQIKRSMDTYARLRNALFHNSKFEATRKRDDGTIQTYQLLDYYGNFLILLSLVVLKATEFDDGHINWDAWIDKQLFK